MQCTKNNIHNIISPTFFQYNWVFSDIELHLGKVQVSDFNCEPKNILYFKDEVK